MRIPGTKSRGAGWQAFLLVLGLCAPPVQPMELPARSASEQSANIQASRPNSLGHQPEKTQVVERQGVERAGAKTAPHPAAGPMRTVRVTDPGHHGVLLSSGEDSQRLQAGLIRSHFGRAPPFSF